MSAELVIDQALTATEARDLTDRIRGTLTVAHDLITKAYQGQAWSALGYDTWDAYCAGEFSDARMVRLNQSQRREIAVEMREAGMSTRAIASGLGVDQTTVADDLVTVRREGNPSPHTAPAIRGSDGKSYSPQTVAQRREVAHTLRGEGLSVQQVADHMGIPKGTAQSLLSAASTDGRGVVKDAASVAVRVERARELARTGASSSQMAREFGMSEEGVKALCRREGIEVRADRILSRTRRLDSNRVIEQTVRSVEIPESLLAAVDFAALDRALLGEWVSSLSESLRALGSLKRQLEKELSQ